MITIRAVHFPCIHVSGDHNTVTVWFWAESCQWVALEESFLSEPGQLIDNNWVVFEYLLEFFFSDLLTTFVLHTHDLAQSVVLDLLFQLCTTTVYTETMLATEFHGHIVSDRTWPSLYLVSVADRAIVILTFTKFDW